jgi:hypothetical protein
LCQERQLKSQIESRCLVHSLSVGTRVSRMGRRSLRGHCQARLWLACSASSGRYTGQKKWCAPRRIQLASRGRATWGRTLYTRWQRSYGRGGWLGRRHATQASCSVVHATQGLAHTWSVSTTAVTTMVCISSQVRGWGRSLLGMCWTVCTRLPLLVLPSVRVVETAYTTLEGITSVGSVRQPLRCTKTCLRNSSS